MLFLKILLIILPIWLGIALTLLFTLTIGRQVYKQELEIRLLRSWTDLVLELLNSHTQKESHLRKSKKG